MVFANWKRAQQTPGGLDDACAPFPFLLIGSAVQAGAGSICHVRDCKLGELSSYVEKSY